MKLYLYLYGSLDIATDPGVNRDISSSQCSAIFSLKNPGFYPMFLLKNWPYYAVKFTVAFWNLLKRFTPNTKS